MMLNDKSRSFGPHNMDLESVHHGLALMATKSRRFAAPLETEK